MCAERREQEWRIVHDRLIALNLVGCAVEDATALVERAGGWLYAYGPEDRAIPAMNIVNGVTVRVGSDGRIARVLTIGRPLSR